MGDSEAANSPIIPEVVQLSPSRLMSKPLPFMCEICNGGFVSDQDLQLHRRGHKVSWKERAKGYEGKCVYVCPVPTCVHHDATRALDDLTAIKEHFLQKHGQKRWWKCCWK